MTESERSGGVVIDGTNPPRETPIRAGVRQLP